jgi:hypothetical protein
MRKFRKANVEIQFSFMGFFLSFATETSINLEEEKESESWNGREENFSHGKKETFEFCSSFSSMSTVTESYVITSFVL